MSGITPMLNQYLSIKEQYRDAILFFRMGDFYEMFFEDAEVAAKILGITLTSRGEFQGDPVPMCGVPHHAAKSYIVKLVKSGLKVAICEQVEDPKASKGIVKREVVRVVTSGSLLEEDEIDTKENLYIAAIAAGKEGYGLAYADLSTGEFKITEITEWDTLLDEIGRIGPRELLVLERDGLEAALSSVSLHIEVLGNDDYVPSTGADLVKEQLGVSSLEGFGCASMSQGLEAAGALVYYLKEIQKGSPAHIKEISVYHLGQSMFLDEATRTHLELLKTMRRGTQKGSLIYVLDKTLTPMGARLLRKWISYPLLEPDPIEERLSAVSFLKDSPLLRQDIRDELKDIYDLERLNSRIALGRTNPRDLIALKISAKRLPIVKTLISETPSTLLSHLSSSLDCLEDIVALIEEAIKDDAPSVMKEGGIIKEGYNKDLDRLIELSRGGKAWIARFGAQEQERTGISSLKVGYNKVFGYYIEVSKPNLHLVPDYYIRKQTLVNAERFITPELKDVEEEILGAEQKRIALEHQLFEQIRRKVASEHQRIKATAEIIAQIDTLCSLAEVAALNSYVRPRIGNDLQISILEGRHPVVEKTAKDEQFVPNDIYLNDSDQQVLIITGPNMAGKSTILRQTALIVLMAQMGSFVPAKEAHIGIVDRIFTRVGASDDLAMGRSTFMVEMTETANILRHATGRSLVILDEIGRGTSTYDGLSIAWAVAEALHDLDGVGVRTLFATHYHELTKLGSTKPRVKNFNIAVREWNGRIIFLRKLVPGGTSRSYGIEVARIAGIPEPVVERAKEVLEQLEKGETTMIPRHLGGGPKGEGVQLSLFEIADGQLVRRIKELDIDTMTPLEALVELHKLKQFIESGQGD